MQNTTILIFYFLVACFITFPLIFHLNDSYHFFSSAVPINGERVDRLKDSLGADTLLDLWTHWFFRKSLLEGKLPVYTDLLYGVANTPISASINNWFSPLVTFFLFPIFGLLGSFNLQTIVTLALNGFSSFLFANYFVKNKKAAFIAGLSVLGSSYVYIRSYDHLGLSSLYFLTFFLLFLFKACKNGGTKRWVAASIFLALSGLLSWYFLLYGVLISCIFILYEGIHTKNYGIIKRYFLMIIGTTALLPPFVVLFVKLFKNGLFQATNVNSFNYSSDLFSLILPNNNSFIWGKLTTPFYKYILFKFTNPLEKESSFLGFIGIFSAFFFGLRWKERYKRSLFIIYFSGIILSLGPYLTILGKSIIPLPYLLLSQVFPILQSPARFIMFSTITGSVFIGFVVNSWLSTTKFSTLCKHLLLLVLAAYLTVENVSFPYNTASFNFDNKFYSGVKFEKGRKIILNLPVSHAIGTGNIYYLSQQTLFEKPMINGYSAPLAKSFVEKTPYSSSTLYPFLCGGTAQYRKEHVVELSKFLEETKTDYIIIQKDVSKLDYCGNASKSINELIKEHRQKIVFEDSKITVLKAR